MTARKPVDLVLAEYQQIKTEQVARIGFRDNLMYVTLVAIAGTLTITHSADSRGYLLLVPAVAFALGWTYLANDNMISAIGRYVREHPGNNREPLCPVETLATEQGRTSVLEMRLDAIPVVFDLV